MSEKDMEDLLCLAHMTPFLQNRQSGIDFWIIMDYNEISEQFAAFFVQNDKSHT